MKQVLYFHLSFYGDWFEILSVFDSKLNTKSRGINLKAQIKKSARLSRIRSNKQLNAKRKKSKNGLVLKGGLYQTLHGSELVYQMPWFVLFIGLLLSIDSSLCARNIENHHKRFIQCKLNNRFMKRNYRSVRKTRIE